MINPDKAHQHLLIQSVYCCLQEILKRNTVIIITHKNIRSKCNLWDGRKWTIFSISRTYFLLYEKVFMKLKTKGGYGNKLRIEYLVGIRPSSMHTSPITLLTINNLYNLLASTKHVWGDKIILEGSILESVLG